MAETICAVATARGSGGIAIIRISGDRALEVLKGAFYPAHSKRAFEPQRMMYGRVEDASGEVLDEALAVFMPGPYSYTREDVAEIHCHGGEIAARRVMRRLIELGARTAEPGEFTKRAFLNGRIDLSRAEAVMQLIGATSEAAARASVRQLEGGVTGFVRDASKSLVQMLSLIEACTDFPDEVEEQATAETLLADIASLRAELARRCDPRSARILREGASIVLAGKPNVGKSSMMNALLNQERAIVTNVPGTTRDVLTERISIGGITAELSDTAGRRATADPVEKIGVERAARAVEQADVVLIVIDASEPLSDEDAQLIADADERSIVCLNKSDLPMQVDPESLSTDRQVIVMSAGRGDGVETLMDALKERLCSAADDDKLTVERQIERVQAAIEALDAARDAIQSGMPVDVASLDLKRALASLSEITAADPEETLLDEIFSNFCVGK